MRRRNAPLAALAVFALGSGCADRDRAVSSPTTPIVTSDSPAPDTSTTKVVPATPPTELPPSDTATGSTLDYPTQTNMLEVDDGVAGSIDELADQSSVVLTGTVTSVSTLGRPSLGEDDYADELISIVVRPTEVLVGSLDSDVVLAWDAFNVTPDGTRQATWIANGVPPPSVGDQLLLFLKAPDRAYVDALDGIPTHVIVQLDGIGFLDDSGAVVLAEPGSPLAQRVSVSHVAAQLQGG